MALPKLNGSPKYNMVIPSKNQTVKYRPYLVKEEKVLMMAMESEDLNAVMAAIADTIVACVDDEIKVNELTMFDMEYMFVQLRGKSVGESAEVKAPCKNCDHATEINISLDDIKVDIPEVENMIELSPEITVEMQWPSYVSIASMDVKSKDDLTNSAFSMVGKCIAAIHTEEERIMISDVPSVEVEEFIESMTNEQFSKLSAYIEKMPKVEKDIIWDCEGCGKEQNQKLQGMMDFF